MNDILFRAILAMDSYNRGGDGLSLDGPGLGLWALGENSESANIVGSGFFAASYIYNGETVISFQNSVTRDKFPSTRDRPYSRGLDGQ